MEVVVRDNLLPRILTELAEPLGSTQMAIPAERFFVISSCVHDFIENLLLRAFRERL
jgi:hypothetical protein